MQTAKDKRANFEKDIFVSIIVGPTGSGKSLFVTSQILENLANDKWDLVISNMNFRTELLTNPEEWKQLAEDYTTSHYPEKWKRLQSDNKTITIRRDSIIKFHNLTIDRIVARVKPSQFVHLDTETTTSDTIKKIIQDKAKEFGLVDENGSLLIRVLLVWDEAYALLESRRSGTSSVIDLSEFALQARHYGCKIWIVSPLFSTIDVRYREICQQAFELKKQSPMFFEVRKYLMSGGNVVGEPVYTGMWASTVVPVYFFYNTWDKPITTLTEIENKNKQVEQANNEAEHLEYVCSVCNKTVIGLSNYRSHYASHSGQSVYPEDNQDTVAEQIKNYLEKHPTAGPTEVSRALNLAYSTVWAGLERMKRRR